jgi:predicted RecB family nuclease
MMPVLDERIIAAYFFCPRKSFLLLRHLAEGKSLPSAHEYMEIFEAKAKKVKDEYIEELREVAHGDNPASTATLEDGKPFLVDAAIDADPLRVVAPLLRKVRTTSKLGRYSYETVLFVGTNKIQKEQVATLGFMAQVLGQRQGVLPETGSIVTGNRKPYRLTLRRPDKAVLSAIDATKGWLLDSNSIPPRVLLNKHCSVCQFHSDCDARAKEADDLSLISSLSKKEILGLHKKGVLTIAQLSCLYRPRRQRRDAKASGRPEKHLPALKALAIRDNLIYVKDPPPLPRKNVEVFLDVEGLPDDEFYYLIGLRICDGLVPNFETNG